MSDFRRLLVGLVTILCLFAVAYSPRGIAGAPMADLGNGNSLTLAQTPCQNPLVLKHIKREYHAQFMAAVVLWEGKNLAACWVSMDPHNIYVIDETGDQGPLPVAVFQALKAGKE